MARQWGNAVHFVGMKCSSCHTLAPIDSIFGGQLPPIFTPWPTPSSLRGGPLPPLYPGMFTVALSEGPLPSLHPLSTSPWGEGFVFLTLQGLMELKY